MVTYSTSQAIWEIASAPVGWPCTTKPWISATLLMDRGSHEAFMHTYVAHSGAEFAAHLHATGGEPVHILASVPGSDDWDVREVVEVQIGMIGGTAVVVLRDAVGSQFCPDAPTLPISTISELVPVASLAPRQRLRPAAQSFSTVRNLHATVVLSLAADAVPAKGAPAAASPGRP